VASALAVGQTSSPTAGSTSKAKEKPWTLSRTPDGQPDLQGVWTNANMVPLERPKELGSKEFYTEQEAAERAKKMKGVRSDGVVTVEAHYDNSQFGLDPGQLKYAPNLRTSIIIGPEGRIPPLTPEAVEIIADRAVKAKGHEFDGPENRPLSERCIEWAQEGPPMLSSGYNNNIEIVQGPGYVGILNEMIHDVRMIPLDGHPHISQKIHQWRGDPRGHWEGNTLVVDSTNFADRKEQYIAPAFPEVRAVFRGAGSTLHIVERFTRTSRDTILYEFAVEDPATWTKPWTGQMVMGPATGEIFEYACQEGNHGLPNDLSGARAAEKKAAEEASKRRSN
jgi:hypothetical protein